MLPQLNARLCFRSMSLSCSFAQLLEVARPHGRTKCFAGFTRPPANVLLDPSQSAAFVVLHLLATVTMAVFLKGPGH